MKVYLSHLDVAFPHRFILHVDYYFLSCSFFFFFVRKAWWFVLTKMEILFWHSLFILSLFFYLMKLYLFHLNVVSPNGFVLRVGYYFLSSCFFFFLFFFFFEKDLLVCFNLLYVVIFLFLVKLYVVTG